MREQGQIPIEVPNVISTFCVVGGHLLRNTIRMRHLAVHAQTSQALSACCSRCMCVDLVSPRSETVNASDKRLGTRSMKGDIVRCKMREIIENRCCESTSS